MTITIEEIVSEYSNMLYRICVILLGNEADAQDAVQDTFCKYLEHSGGFKDKEHEKAWLIRVATNRCRDMQRFRLRHPKVDIESITAGYEDPGHSEVLAALMRLPSSVKSVIYLHYIEGYKTSEIAEMLRITTNAVKKRMQRGRAMLRLTLGEDGQESAGKGRQERAGKGRQERAGEGRRKSAGEGRQERAGEGGRKSAGEGRKESAGKSLGERKRAVI